MNNDQQPLDKTGSEVEDYPQHLVRRSERLHAAYQRGQRRKANKRARMAHRRREYALGTAKAQDRVLNGPDCPMKTNVQTARDNILKAQQAAAIKAARDAGVEIKA